MKKRTIYSQSTIQIVSLTMDIMISVNTWLCFHYFKWIRGVDHLDEPLCLFAMAPVREIRKRIN